MANHPTARLTLLIHMLCNLGGSDVPARTLKEIADRKMDRSSKSVFLDEILKVRMLQERYEQGEVGMYCFCLLLEQALTACRPSDYYLCQPGCNLEVGQGSGLG
jgi:hypothetical protein